MQVVLQKAEVPVLRPGDN